MSGFMRKAAIVVGAVALVAMTAGSLAPVLAPGLTGVAGIGSVSVGTLTCSGTYNCQPSPPKIMGTLRRLRS